MEVKGTALVVVPEFIKSKFGADGLNRWRDALSPEAKKIYSGAILTTQWFPLIPAYTEPTQKMCEMFYGGKLDGAFECGRFSADYALKGIYKIFVMLGSPEFILKQATVILPTYYRPSRLEIASTEKGRAVIRIVDFPEPAKVLDARIAGWMQRALEICGCRNVSVRVTASMADKSPYTEFQTSWS